MFLTCYVDKVEEDEGERLVPLDAFVPDGDDEQDDGEAVGDAVPGQRPPVKRHHHAGADSAARGHRQDVEDGAADDGADADVTLCDECADHVDEQLWRRRRRRHERRASYVARHLQR